MKPDGQAHFIDGGGGGGGGGYSWRWEVCVRWRMLEKGWGESEANA